MPIFCTWRLAVALSLFSVFCTFHAKADWFIYSRYHKLKAWNFFWKRWIFFALQFLTFPKVWIIHEGLLSFSFFYEETSTYIELTLYREAKFERCNWTCRKKSFLGNQANVQFQIQWAACRWEWTYARAPATCFQLPSARCTSSNGTAVFPTGNVTVLTTGTQFHTVVGPPNLALQRQILMPPLTPKQYSVLHP